MSADSLPPEHSERKLRRRPWLILGGVALVQMGVLVWLHFFQDGPPPDDRNMMPHWSERGGMSNPLAVFCRSLRGSSIVDWSKLSEEARAADVRTREEMQEFVDAHAKEIAAFESLMSTDAATWQWPEGPAMAEYAHAKPEDSSNLSECQSLANTLRMRARLLSMEGDINGASQLCLRMLQWVQGMHGAEGRSAHLIVSQNTQSTALRTLRETLAMPDASAELIRKCLHCLGSTPAISAGGVEFAMRAEYAFFKGCVEQEPVASGIGASHFNQDLGVLSKLFFKKNRTLTLRNSLDVPMMAAIAQGWSSTADALVEHGKLLAEFETHRGNVLLLLDSNYAGKGLICFAGETEHYLLLKTVESVTLHSQTVLLLALRLHELDHGNLPATLDALVPVYLSGVPEDAFARKPMRWDAIEKDVYSVGRDGKDDGGMIREDIHPSWKDFGLRYPWAFPHTVITKP